MNFIKASLALALVTSLVACSNSSDGGSGGGSPSKFADPAASKSVTTSFAALQHVQAKKSHKNGLRSFLQSSDVQQKDVQVLTEKLEQKLNTKDCVMKLPSEEAPQEPSNSPGNGLSVKVSDSFFEITGDNCPLNATIDVDSSGDAKNIKVKFVMTIVVKTPELQKEMNLTKSSFSGELTGTANQLNPSEFTMKLIGAFVGEGTTLSHGPFSSNTGVNFDVAATMPQQTPGNGDAGDAVNMMNITMETTEKSSYVFGAERTDLYSHVKMDSQGVIQEHFINGQKVTPEQYADYASKIHFPGMDTGNGNPDNQTPVVSSSCELLAFDAAQIPETTLKQVMNSSQGINSLIPAASARVSACGQTAQNTSRVNGKNVFLEMTFMAEANQALIDVNGVKEYLYLQPEFNDFLTKTVSGVSIVYACQKVPSCGQ